MRLADQPEETTPDRPPHATNGARSVPASSDGAEGAERSGSPVGGSLSAAARYIANRVTPPDPVRIAEQRNVRFSRRRQSAEWLRLQTFTNAGMQPVYEKVDTVTNQPRSIRASDPEWIRPPRLARCSWAVMPEVGLHYEEGSAAYFSGVERCASIWACPVCAAVIRQERAQEIEKAVTLHQAEGGALMFVTLTLRHSKSDSLAVNLEAAIGGWKRLLQGKAWASMKERYGIQGYIRSVEVTYSPANGWHPHIHAIFFIEKPLDDRHSKIFGDELFGRWQRYVMDRGAKSPSRRRGVDVQQVDTDGKVIAQYLSKMQDDHAKASKWKIGQEMARGDVKSGGNGSMTPFELLDPAQRSDGVDDEVAYLLWTEFVDATRSRRAITWSRGLKKRFHIEELDDDQAMDEALVVRRAWITDKRTYEQVRRENPALLSAALEALECGNLALVRAILPGQIDPELDNDFQLTGGDSEVMQGWSITTADLPDGFRSVDLDSLVLPF